MGDTARSGEEFTLLHAFLNNDEMPIRTFYVAEYPKTKQYVLKNGGTTDQVNDIFQEAFFAFWKKLNTGKFIPRNKTEMEAYLFTIAKNKWIDEVKSEGKKRTISMDDNTYKIPSTDTPQTSDSNEKEQELNITLQAFENLGSACKEVLTQFYFNKMSFRDIALQNNMEEASIKNKKYRCIQKLKELALQHNHNI